MKKSKKSEQNRLCSHSNPVAKFAHQFNKAHVFEDKNKYRRNAKHRKQEASPMTLVRVIGEASCNLDFAIRNLEIGNSLKSSAGLMKPAI